ncbi:MAG: hypothetical protein JWO63_84 [Frankiales bacterium]|nr:hypothetical protein [Frankiales bacterium]
MPTAKMKTYKVAPRHSVTGTKPSEDDPKVKVPVTIEAGGTIELDETEGAKLQKLGFLLGDNGEAALITAEGPPVAAGADIKEA